MSNHAMLLSLSLLTACGEAVPPPPTPEQALALKPADLRLEIIVRPDPP